MAKGTLSTSAIRLRKTNECRSRVSSPEPWCHIASTERIPPKPFGPFATHASPANAVKPLGILAGQLLATMNVSCKVRCLLLLKAKQPWATGCSIPWSMGAFPTATEPLPLSTDHWHSTSCAVQVASTGTGASPRDTQHFQSHSGAISGVCLVCAVNFSFCISSLSPPAAFPLPI
eukprot:GGOE01060516.1.p1 GENE.GGOE01060516.1~~GGOE01060516.1.p1  ORF type:complete len:175 (-),score=1.52 GGOE01060516.1:129-653(-)